MERHQIRRYIGRGIGLALGLVAAAAGPGVNTAPAVAQAHAGPRAAQTLARVDRGAGMIEGKLTRVDGREARFADLQEGAKVKAFYEERGAKLVATRIEVTS